MGRTSAKRFVASMWNPQQGRFYVGTLTDGVTPNQAFKPEDVNSWRYLAFANPDWYERTRLGRFAMRPATLRKLNGTSATLRTRKSTDSTDGCGVIAASKNGLRDCDGSKYFALPHVGATAW
jgi:hypothetical protein